MNINEKVSSYRVLMIVGAAVLGLAACGGGEDNTQEYTSLAQPSATEQIDFAPDTSKPDDTEQIAAKSMASPMHGGRRGH